MQIFEQEIDVNNNNSNMQYENGDEIYEKFTPFEHAPQNHSHDG